MLVANCETPVFGVRPQSAKIMLLVSFVSLYGNGTATDHIMGRVLAVERGLSQYEAYD